MSCFNVMASFLVYLKNESCPSMWYIFLTSQVYFLFNFVFMTPSMVSIFSRSLWFTLIWLKKSLLGHFLPLIYSEMIQNACVDLLTVLCSNLQCDKMEIWRPSLVQVESQSANQRRDEREIDQSGRESGRCNEGRLNELS